MKGNLNRERLENELYKSLYEINLTRENKEAVINKLLARGYLAGDIQQIIGGNTALEFLGDIELGVVANAFYKTTYDEMVNPSHYFDEIQLREIENFKLELKNDKITFPVTFKNMLQFAPGMWSGKISIQRYVKLHQDRISTYNFEIQRNPKYEKYRGTIIKKPNISPESVTEITEKILKNTYLYDDVTLNILANGMEDFEFKQYANSEYGDIILNSGILNLTDGAHRLKGAEGALLINPNIQGNFILVITNFDTGKANDYIRQKNKRNEIDKEYLEANKKNKNVRQH